MARLVDELRSTFKSGGDITAVSNRPELTRALSMLMSDSDELVRQRACRRLGEIAAAFEPSKLEQFIRRLMWRLNPESGDTPHGVPEAVGEIGAHAPQRVLPFVPVLTQYFDDEKLLPGLLQALGRIYQQKHEIAPEILNTIIEALSQTAPAVYGNAALALLRLSGATEIFPASIREDVRRTRVFSRNEYFIIELRELPQILGDLNDLCFISSEPLEE